MLVLLPPSETKHPGGDGPPLALDSLAFDSARISRVRDRMVRALTSVSARPRAARTALGLGPKQLDELEHNVRLLEAPTMPAIERYTGVLYDALDVRSMRPAQRRRADERLAIGSALFGVVRANDPIPAYRLSAGSRLPRIQSLAAVWKPALTPALAECAEDELVVDLRSGAYQALAPVPGAVTVRVMTERPDGSRSVVSHFNKATKGRLARVLATAPAACSSIDDVERLAREDGMRVERTSPCSLDVVTHA